MSHRHVWLTTTVVVGSLSLSVVAAAPDGHCERGVQRDDKSPFSYAERGNRCEGDFNGEVGKRMRLVSLTHGVPALGSVWPSAVDFRWPAGVRDLRLHVEATAQAQYYRMDANVATGQRLFRWPLDVLRERSKRKPKILPDDLAFLAHGRSGRDDSYRPVPLGLNKPEGNREPYVLVIRVPDKVSEAYASLDDAQVSNTVNVWKRRQVELPAPLEPQDTFSLTVPESTLGAGRYKIELRTAGHGLNSIKIEFDHD